MGFLIGKKKKSSRKTPCDIIGFLVKCKMTIHPPGSRSRDRGKNQLPQIYVNEPWSLLFSSESGPQTTDIGQREELL